MPRPDVVWWAFFFFVCLFFILCICGRLRSLLRRLLHVARVRVCGVVLVVVREPTTATTVVAVALRNRKQTTAAVFLLLLLLPIAVFFVFVCAVAATRHHWSAAMQQRGSRFPGRHPTPPSGVLTYFEIYVLFCQIGCDHDATTTPLPAAASRRTQFKPFRTVSGEYTIHRHSWHL